MSEFYVNGTPLSTYGVTWDGSQLFDKPEKDVKFFQIPARNGDLSIFNGRYKNIDIKVNCFIREDFPTNYNNLINFLYSQKGYARLENDIDSEVYRMGQFVTKMTPQTGAYNKSGIFTLVFNCMPQRYLKSGEEQISGFDFQGNLTITNPTPFDAYPFIYANNTTGTEFTSIVVNGTAITGGNYDLGTMEYDGATGYLTHTQWGTSETEYVGRVALKSGENTVTVTNASGYVIPHWWML